MSSEMESHNAAEHLELYFSVFVAAWKGPGIKYSPLNLRNSLPNGSRYSHIPPWVPSKRVPRFLRVNFMDFMKFIRSQIGLVMLLWEQLQDAPPHQQVDHGPQTESQLLELIIRTLCHFWHTLRLVQHLLHNYIVCDAVLNAELDFALNELKAAAVSLVNYLPSHQQIIADWESETLCSSCSFHSQSLLELVMQCWLGRIPEDLGPLDPKGRCITCGLCFSQSLFQ